MRIKFYSLIKYQVPIKWQNHKNSSKYNCKIKGFLFQIRFIIIIIIIIIVIIIIIIIGVVVVVVVVVILSL